MSELGAEPPWTALMEHDSVQLPRSAVVQQKAHALSGPLACLRMALLSAVRLVGLFFLLFVF